MKRVGSADPGFRRRCIRARISSIVGKGPGSIAVKLFSGRTAELKTMNRILTDAARKRGQRVEELELELGRLKSEYVLRVQRIEELELKLQHHERGEVEAQKLQRELTEAATKRSLRVQELEQELLAARTEIALRIQE